MTTSRSSRFTEHRFAICALVLAFAMAPLRFAHAAPASAKAEYQEGVNAYVAEHFAEAATAFERAYALAPRPLILFNIGQCRRKMGDFDKAIAAYKKYLVTAGANEPAQTLAEARSYIAQIEAFTAEQHDAANRPVTMPTDTSQNPPPDATINPYQQPPPRVDPPPPTSPGVVIEQPRPRRPLYKSPALWGGVAAGVVVIVALGLGIGLGTKPHDPDTTLGTRTPDFH